MQKKSDRTPMEKLAYRVDEASEVSGLGRSKLYEEIKAGRLRSVRVGGRRLILHEDLVALLKGDKDSTARPTAESAVSASPTGEAQAHDPSLARSPESSSQRGRFWGSRDAAALNRKTNPP